MAEEIPNRSADRAAPPQLPRDLRGGVHYDLTAPDTVTFVLRAPFKPFVSLVGDFNEWHSRSHPLVTDGQGTWWITLPHPGETRYGYYVAVDDQSHAWVGDPYATEVHWDSTGPWAFLPASPPTFRWTDIQWKTPALRDIVIYELCVRDFSGRWAPGHPIYGKFPDLTHYVDYFADMHINAVEIMPVTEFPGDSSWGYNPVFYFSPERAYGNPTQLKTFVNACHRRGVAVILDMVFNHAWGDHPYYQMYPPMFGPKGQPLADMNPFFHHTPKDINSWGGVDWDHFAQDTTRHFQDVVRFWLAEYHIDGFRFDWTGGVDYDSNHPMQPGFNPYNGLSAICWAAREANPDCILLAEHWVLNGTHPQKTGAKLVAETEMDACWNGDFHHTLDEVLNQRWEWEKKNIRHAVGGFRDLGYVRADQVINYTASHDEVRTEHEIKYYTSGNMARPAGMSLDQLALAKGMLGLATLFTAPGVPMLWAGQEFGEDTPRTIDFLPLTWSKLHQKDHFQHQQLTRRLIRLRRDHPALRSDWIEFYDDDFATTKLVRFKRWDGAGDAVVVALNFGQASVETGLGFPWNGYWREMMTDRVYQIESNWQDFRLEPWGAAIFVPLSPAPDSHKTVKNTPHD